jgi:hypothetical protein
MIQPAILGICRNNTIKLFFTEDGRVPFFDDYGLAYDAIRSIDPASEAIAFEFKSMEELAGEIGPEMLVEYSGQRLVTLQEATQC